MSVTTDQRGAAAIIVIMILLVITVLVISTIGFTGVDDLEGGYGAEVSGDAVLSAESCVEEAMTRITRDSSYAGGTLTVGDAECTIAVTGTPCGSCTIDVSAVAENYTRKIQADITVSGGSIDIVSWEEVN